MVAKATTVTLTGLGPAEVATLIARVAGRDPRPTWWTRCTAAPAATRSSSSRPRGCGRCEGTLRAVPPGVRDAVRRRVALLPDAVVEVLTAAAVLGQDFDRAVLAASAGLRAGGGRRPR